MVRRRRRKKRVPTGTVPLGLFVLARPFGSGSRREQCIRRESTSAAIRGAIPIHRASPIRDDASPRQRDGAKPIHAANHDASPILRAANPIPGGPILYATMRQQA
jgi:hypothetical protein